jgi:hypothetical protein
MNNSHKKSATSSRSNVPAVTITVRFAVNRPNRAVVEVLTRSTPAAGTDRPFKDL